MTKYQERYKKYRLTKRDRDRVNRFLSKCALCPDDLQKGIILAAVEKTTGSDADVMNDWIIDKVITDKSYNELYAIGLPCAVKTLHFYVHHFRFELSKILAEKRG